MMKELSSKFLWRFARVARPTITAPVDFVPENKPELAGSSQTLTAKLKMQEKTAPRLHWLLWRPPRQLRCAFETTLTIK